MPLLGFVFTIAVLLVALYGANSLFLAALYLRSRRRPEGSAAVPVAWPHLTVQLPVFNERYVVQRLIDAVARLDYPRDRLHIQVLDDSSDDTTSLAQARVARWRARGLDVELLHRADRSGFKAGALAHGLASAHGDYVALFDADFVPPPDFVKRALAPLLADPGLAFVQARWGYLNPADSALTRAQTIALDGHFVVEHLARNRSGLLMNFNGTAGVWRRAAIDAAGGWQADTLTEDVDLSFRAQLAGWRALYLPDLVAPAELPPQLAAFRRQQARWSTGAAQCLVKLGGALLRGRLDAAPGGATRLPWPARLEALLHLGVWLAHPMSLLLLLLTLPALLGRMPLAVNLGIFWLVALGPVVAYALSQRHLYPDWRRRMAAMPVLALLGTGLALSNTLAIARGLGRRGTPFRRTPKFSAEGGRRWAASSYALPFQWVTLGELALAGYALFTAAVAVWAGSYVSVPFLLLYVAGYGTMGVQGLREAWLAHLARPTARRARTLPEPQAE